MKTNRPLVLMFAILIIAMLVPAVAFAQQAKRDIFANPENLKVLPKDISSHELSSTMKGFAMGLGVRCETCHVGEPNTPLSTFDFASDEKAMKHKARVMIGMVQDINNSYVTKLNEIEETQRVAVRCVTCHRGQQQPKLIEDILDEQLAANGLAAALDKYAQLRKDFYGSHSFDFSEFTLPMYIQGLAGSDQTGAAIALAQVNTEHFPDSYYSYFILAESYTTVGQTDKAIESYARAIELNPQAKSFLEAKIATLKDASE